MFRLATILIVITALSLGVSWVADEPGHVVIDWGDYHLETSLLVVLAGICILSLLCMIAYYILFSILRTPRSWLRSRLARRQALGLEALTSAFAAIATQDLRSARRQIGKAQQYLPHQPLTLMLASQVSRLEGNESQSRLYLEQMLKAGSTEYMALRGLIETSRRSLNDDAAIAHAEKALALKGPDAWLVRTLVDLYMSKGRSGDAVRLVESAQRKRTMTRREATDLSARILAEHARPLVEEGRYAPAVHTLKDALRLKPHFVPATALLARCRADMDDIPGALNLISSEWKNAPHPLLTEAILYCHSSPKQRAKVGHRAEKLARMYPEHRESHFLRAALALKNGKAEAARDELKHLLESKESERACRLMAESYQDSGDIVRATEWTKRANAAPHEPAFTCDNCHRPSPSWHLTCPSCHSVGTVESQAA
jgi:HemY protein